MYLLHPYFVSSDPYWAAKKSEISWSLTLLWLFSEFLPQTLFRQILYWKFPPSWFILICRYTYMYIYRFIQSVLIFIKYPYIVGANRQQSFCPGLQGRRPLSNYCIQYVTLLLVSQIILYNMSQKCNQVYHKKIAIPYNAPHCRQPMSHTMQIVTEGLVIGQAFKMGLSTIGTRNQWEYTKCQISFVLVIPEVLIAKYRFSWKSFHFIRLNIFSVLHAVFQMNWLDWN